MLKRTLIQTALLFPSLALLAADPCSALPPGQGESTPGEVAQRLAQRLQQAEDGGFSGVVLIAQGERILFHEGFGTLDLRAGDPMSRDAVFTVGSITKPFTATAILRLEEAGKLSVQDPVSRYLGPMPEDKSEITLHHLLTHSSGLPTALGFDFDPLSRDELIKKALAAPLLFEPGSRYEYSNVGYSLLAAVIEKVSGKPYGEYLHREVLLPAGLKETGFDLRLWPKGRIAQGVVTRGDKAGEVWGSVVERYGKEGPSWYLVGNGGLHSTAADMLLFHRAIQAGKILSPATWQRAFQPLVAENEGATSHYGYGWSTFASPWGGKVVAHNGGNPYFFADFQRYEEDDLFVFLACNRVGRGVFRLAEELAQIVADPHFEGEAAEGVSLLTGSPQKVTVAGRWGLKADPLGKSVARLLEAMATPEDERTSEWTQGVFLPALIEKVGAEQLEEIVSMLSADAGAFEVERAEVFDNERVEVLLKLLGQPFKILLLLKVDPENPTGIAGLGAEMLE